ncbi:ABC transporter permease [Gordonia sp. PKS22-38]|uniref:ABC transporter permease n=1 Tax=Gordonia prachuapensis TaxID=3115651 RepID=A0ABU7MNN2_9ACTN|nr:ABC transporter permease [Gordonia sp. PKS22-38]
MAMLPSPGDAPTTPSPRTIIGLIVGVAALLAAMVTAFALPAANSAPHDVPIGVVASSTQADRMSQQLNGFDVTRYDDADAAQDAIEQRDIYGALIVDGQDVNAMVASAASPAVATAISTIAANVAGTTGGSSQTVDIRSFPPDDPRGAGLAAGALPLALGGWISAMVIMLLIHTPGSRILAALGVSVVGGLVLVATLTYVIGTFDGSYWVTSVAAMLGIAATCFAVLGLRELLGGAGLAIAAILLIFLGNPLSGLASAPEMLPTPWGYIGQLLPPGATGTMLRDVAFFNGNGAMHSILVLLCWLLGGLALYLLGVWRNRRSNEVDEDEIHIGRHAVDEATATT